MAGLYQTPLEQIQDDPESGTARLRVRAMDAMEDHEPGPLAAALIDAAPVTIYFVDNNGQLLYANREYRRFFGLTSEQSLEDWAEGLHPDDRDRQESNWADFCCRPRAVRFEYRTINATGAVRHMSEVVVPAPAMNGFVGTITDVSDLVAAREQLTKVESLHRSTFEQLPLGITYATREGRLLSWNSSFTTMLGLGPRMLLGKALRDLTFADDIAVEATALAALWEGTVSTCAYEKRCLTQDQSIVWVRVTAALVRDANRQPICQVGFVEDISERKRQDHAMQRAHALLEAVVASVPAALLACDINGDVILCNPAAAALYALETTGTESEPSQLPTFKAPAFAADGVTPLNYETRPLVRALRGDQSSHVEVVLVPPDGKRQTHLSSARQLLDARGEVLGAVTMLQDISHLRETEAAVERVHKQLLDASRQAGMAEVATNVLHNVGNVLNSVNVSANLVSERMKCNRAAGLAQVAALLREQSGDLAAFFRDDARARDLPRYLEALSQQLQTDQAQTLEELRSLRENIDHIKDAIAMQQNYAKRCGVAETIDVQSLVEDSLRMNSGALTRHQVALQRDFAPVPQITVDKHRVLQILVNLVRNAKYACEESGRADKCVCIRVRAQGPGVRISVIDNGIGIRPENMERLFAHGFTTRQSGHGFGLHSAALAAGELGGQLRAHSAGEGQGATFELDLPLQPPEVSRG